MPCIALLSNRRHMETYHVQVMYISYLYIHIQQNFRDFSDHSLQFMNQNRRISSAKAVAGLKLYVSTTSVKFIEYLYLYPNQTRLFMCCSIRWSMKTGDPLPCGSTKKNPSSVMPWEGWKKMFILEVCGTDLFVQEHVCLFCCYLFYEHFV